MADVLTRPRPMENAQERLESATRKLLLIALAFIPVALIIALRAAGGFGTLGHPAAMDCAQVGRNVLEGKGFTTNSLTPLSVYIQHPDIASGAKVSDLTNPPLYPLTLAVLFGAFGSNDAVVIAASLGFFALTTLMLFLLARRQFGLSAAALAAALWATQYDIVRTAIAGTSAMAAAFCMALFWYVLTAPGEHAPRHYFKAGLLFGLAYLANYSMLLLLPAVLVYVWFVSAKRKRASVALLLVGALLVASPWLIRNTIVAHNPLFCMSMYDVFVNSDAYPSLTVHRTFANVQSPLLYSLTHVPQLAIKAINGLGEIYYQWPGLLGVYVLPFFVLSLFTRVADKSLLASRRLLVAAIVIITLVVSLGDQASLHLVMLVPLMTLFAAGCMLRTVDRVISAPIRRGLVIAAIVIGAALPTALALTKSITPPPAGIPAQFADMDQILPSQAIVVSDCPWAVAWYGRRTALWLPLNPRQLAQIGGKLGSVDAVFVSRYAATFAQANAAALVRLLTQKGAGGEFHVARAYRVGDVLLTSRRYSRTE